MMISRKELLAVMEVLVAMGVTMVHIIITMRMRTRMTGQRMTMKMTTRMKMKTGKPSMVADNL